MLVRCVLGAWINPTFFETGLFLLAAVWALEMIRRPYPLRGRFAFIPLGAMVLWPVIQLASRKTVSDWETENAVLLWSSNFLIVFFMLQLAGDSKRRWKLLQILSIFGFVFILLALLEHFSAPDRIFWSYDPGFNDTFGLFVSRDRYAAFAELILSLLFGLAFQNRKYMAWWLGMAAATIAAVIGSASRAGAVLITAETLVLLFLLRTSAKKQVKASSNKLLLFAAMVGAFTIVVGVGTLIDRLSDPDPYHGRREMLRSSIRMIREQPVFGFGLGNFQNAYPRYAEFDSDKVINHAHNEWAVDGGIPYFASMAIAASWVAPRAVCSISGIGLLTVFAHSIVDFPLHDPPLEFWTFALLGALASSEA
jgi:hypothetical protein